MNRPSRVPGPRAIAHALSLVLTAAPLLAAPAATELRALIGGIATVSAENSEGVGLSIGYDESVALLMPKDSPFVQGVEIEIKSPRAAIAVPGGFAYELWQRVDPEPDMKRFAYRGERIIMQALPARDRADFEAEYGARLRVAYPRQDFGTVLPYRRIFVVAHRAG